MPLKINKFKKMNVEEYNLKFNFNYKCNKLEGFYVQILDSEDETPANEGVLVYNGGKLHSLIKLHEDITCILFGEKPSERRIIPPITGPKAAKIEHKI